MRYILSILTLLISVNVYGASKYFIDRSTSGATNIYHYGTYYMCASDSSTPRIELSSTTVSFAGWGGLMEMTSYYIKFQDGTIMTSTSTGFAGYYLTESSAAATYAYAVELPYYLEKDSATATYAYANELEWRLDVDSAVATYWQRAEMANYITASSITATYLTRSSATITYFDMAHIIEYWLSKSSAMATYAQEAQLDYYLEKSSAVATYLTISSAAITYLDISTINSNLLTISSATANFLTQSSATVTYANKDQLNYYFEYSSSVYYVTKDSAAATYAQIPQLDYYLEKSSASATYAFADELAWRLDIDSATANYLNKTDSDQRYYNIPGDTLAGDMNGGGNNIYNVKYVSATVGISLPDGTILNSTSTLGGSGWTAKATSSLNMSNYSILFATSIGIGTENPLWDYATTTDLPDAYVIRINNDAGVATLAITGITNPGIYLSDTDGGSNNKAWWIYNSGQNLNFYPKNDAGTNETRAMGFYPNASPAYIDIGYSLYSGSPLNIWGNYIKNGDAGTVTYATGDGDLYNENVLEADGISYLTGGVDGDASSIYDIKYASVTVAVSYPDGSLGTTAYSVKRTTGTSADDLYSNITPLFLGEEVHSDQYDLFVASGAAKGQWKKLNP